MHVIIIPHNLPPSHKYLDPPAEKRFDLILVCNKNELESDRLSRSLVRLQFSDTIFAEIAVKSHSIEIFEGRMLVVKLIIHHLWLRGLLLMLMLSLCLPDSYSEGVLYAQTVSSSPDNQADHNHSTMESYYTCSMHPKIRSDKPGKCPVCYMNLTRVEIEKFEDSPTNSSQLWHCKDYPDITSNTEGTCPKDGTPMVRHLAEKPGDTIGRVKLKKSQMSHFKPDYFLVSPMKMTRRIRLLGSVIQSEEKDSSIPARVDGRVEEVNVKSTGSLIRPGDAVLKLYSPKLITAGEEYILAKASVAKGKSKEFKNLLQQSEERLRLWGIGQKQFESWYRNGKVPRNITIYSNVRGIVTKRHAVKGSYFNKGQNFFELSDLSTIWVEIDVYEQNAALVKLGQTVSLKFTALPRKTFEGKIDFISPVLDPKSRTLKVRVSIENEEGKLMPGMAATAFLQVDFEGTPLVLPRSAIIDTGERKVAWVKIDEERFQAKIVETGIESEGYVELISGLKEGDLVVVEGNFLLDAQAQLFGGYEDFSGQ